MVLLVKSIIFIKQHTVGKNKLSTNWKTEILPQSYKETKISVQGKLIFIKHVFKKNECTEPCFIRALIFFYRLRSVSFPIWIYASKTYLLETQYN